jgi:nucleoside 2-deoxyribosyltransferase
MKTSVKIYFAAPLFTQAEWQWNENLAAELGRHNLDITLPQKRAEPMLFGVEEYSPSVLFEDNLRGIENADIILAVFDQADPDSGTCFECGYAYSKGLPIIGLRTDLRKTGDDNDSAINLMLSKSCKTLVELPFDKRNNLEWVAKKVSEAIEKVCLHSTTKKNEGSQN